MVSFSAPHLIALRQGFSLIQKFTLAGQWPLRISLSLSPQIWDYRCLHTCLTFYMDARDSNSGSHTCSASAFTELPLHPYFWIFKTKCVYACLCMGLWTRVPRLWSQQCVRHLETGLRGVVHCPAWILGIEPPLQLLKEKRNPNPKQVITFWGTLNSRPWDMFKVNMADSVCLAMLNLHH